MTKNHPATYIYTYIYKLTFIVEGDPKAPFSIAVGEGDTAFPGFLHLPL